ncbi:ABC transporter transmembrane domain-containing protein, partial [Sphingomonas bacterium]|uniref:ABC transporter transmembrane domain-containing protein n=1 Tax=Sphingomonas bacterium TaxID=1895847 RepID=UPI0020C6F8B7
MADPRPARPRRLGSLSLVWRQVARYPGQLAVAIAALLTTSLSTSALPYAVRSMIDRGFGHGGDPAHINRVFTQLGGLVIVLALGTALRFYFVSWLGERTVADVREEVQRNLLRLAPRFFEENRPAEIASRLTADTAQIEIAVGTTVSVALRNALTGVASTVTMFVIAPRFAGSLLIGIPVVMLPLVLLGRRVRGFSRSSQDRIADIGALAVETLGAMKVVQAFGQEAREGERFTAAVERGFGAAKRRIRVRALMTALVILLLFGAITALLWSTVSDVAHGQLSGGSLTGFLVAATLAAGSFASLSEVYGDLLRAAGAAERLNELLAEVPDIAPPAQPAA